MRLATALYLAPDLSVNQTPSRVLKARSHGGLDPDNLLPIMHRTLLLICHGYSNAEIAERTNYALDTVRDRVKGLLAIFCARNRTHLAALAVAQGYVDVTLAPLAA